MESLPRRRTVRLRDYDYALNGVYFVTISTHERASIFGTVEDAVITLNGIGRIVDAEWRRTSEIRPEVELDAFVVMPNHLHGILAIAAGGGCPSSIETAGIPVKTLRRDPRSLGSIIAGFKGAVTRRVNAMPDYLGSPIWQRNYYEHVIRNDADLDRVRDYIDGNPARWWSRHQS